MFRVVSMCIAVTVIVLYCKLHGSSSIVLEIMEYKKRLNNIAHVFNLMS